KEAILRLHPAAVLSAVASLRAEPSVLSDLVTLALKAPDETKSPFSGLVAELGQNPSLANRWDDVDRILDRNPMPNVKIAMQPSHAQAVEKFTQCQDELVRKGAFRNIMGVRYLDAPFPAFEHVLRISDMVAGEGAIIVVGYCLLVVSQNLPRLSTNWERPLFDLDATRRELVRQLRMLEARRPALMAEKNLRPALMAAYGATRIAAEDAARHWAAIVDRGKPISLRTSERALAVTRDLDTLERVWAQVKQLSPTYRPSARTLNILDIWYAQHLVRLGARDVAVELARKYPPHATLTWLFTDDDALPGTDRNASHYVGARARRALAAELARSGLDQEDVLSMMSIHAPAPVLRGLRP
ncbi:hypothetical protein EXIGLDRAFT_735394, partial [Exidia glandulosa HHB12029]